MICLKKEDTEEVVEVEMRPWVRIPLRVSFF